MKSSINQKSNKFAIVAATGLLTFAAIFFGTQMLLNSVYGIEVDVNASVGAGLSVPVNADANSQIESYISFVKAEICPTLNDSVEEQECRNL